MKEQYDFKKIESTWQQKWQEADMYRADDSSKTN